MMYSVEAYAKLNLFLSVTARRADGYHDIDSVMQQVSLSDTLKLELLDAGIKLTCSDTTIPCDKTNLAWRAAEAFFAYTGHTGGLHIHLVKGIPMQAGLAGGSTDAAAVLVGCNQLFHTNLSIETLCDIGARIGADVPFCIRGGAARTEGIGEVITPCTPLPACTIVIAIGDVGVCTKDAYALVDKYPVPPRSADAMLAALDSGSLAAISAAGYNVFSAVAPPSVEPLRVRMESLGADFAMMSGTGSSVFGLFAENEVAQRACTALQADGYRAYICSPIRG